MFVTIVRILATSLALAQLAPGHRLPLGRLLSPFDHPSSELAHLRMGQNSEMPERAISTTVMANATMRNVASCTSAECVTEPILAASAPSASQTEHWPRLASVHSTPVYIDRFEFYLQYYPCQDLVHYVCEGLRGGFDIGFLGTVADSRPPNLRSAVENPEAVTAAIFKEVQRGHTSGPFAVPPFSPFHCSPLGAVPKKDGTFRIILDLSSPRGLAVNEGISKEEFSVRYSSFDDAVSLVHGLGPHAFMAKLDIKHAFRLCPVHPSQWSLLGFCWNQQFFFDTRLPFGSRSSPCIFNTFADLLWWILINVGGICWLIHYLDDFLICAPTRELCLNDMETMQAMFSELGVPLASDKTEGPTPVLTFLGIEIDTRQRIVRLPPDKLMELSQLLQSWVGRKKCTKRELLSLIGSLSFASKVVKPGRIFLRRLIDLSTRVTRLHHHLSLDSEARADIQWWIDFLPAWNGINFIQSEPVTSASLKLFTDASNTGFGAVYGSEWFSLAWSPSLSELHINAQELFAIVAAVYTWGEGWQNRQILFFTDNLVITQVWRTGTSSNPIIMKLVRNLFFFSATRNINILMKHIPGLSNCLADALSRLQVSKFRKLHKTASNIPARVPSEIWTILDEK